MSSQIDKEQESGLTLQDLVSILWDGKLVLGAAVIVAAALAVAYLWVSTPIYNVDALVQVEEKKGGASAMFGEMGAMFDVSSPAETEIEIIKSRMVLGKVVQEQHLDIVARPKVMRIIGNALLRRQANPPRIEVERFDVSDSYYGKPFQIKQVDAQSFVLTYAGLEVLRGKVGQSLMAVFQGDTLQLFVAKIVGKPGQEFNLTKLSPLAAVEDLSRSVSAMEKGKKTGMIALSMQGPDIQKITMTLNAVALAYVQQNVDRKSEEAAKTLAFLRSQLPELKRVSDTAESKLNAYRLQVGSIDLNAESKLILDQGVDLQSDLMKLQGERAELMRLYKEDHPNIKTLDQKIEQLNQQMGGVNNQVRRLPKTQQEILRLAQEAKVAAELYNTMLNNAQQLEVAKAGQVGNVRVIDPAIASYIPVKPKKASTFVLVCLLGFFAGAGLLLLMRFWSKGVQDPKELESRFGLPVYASIMHSNTQRKILEAIKRKDAGTKILAIKNTEDLSVEGFRSLRTTLHFSMHDAPNNVLLLVGPSPAIGKSFVSSNLATVLAQAGKKVCLVDSDLRRGHLHQVFDLGREPGLSDYLANAAQQDSIVRKTDVENLSVITTGKIPPNPSELLMSKRLEDLLQHLSGKFDFVIVDSPPVLAVTDALILAKFAGSTLMVLRHGQHRMAEIEQTLSRFDHAGLKVKGCVFNDVTAGLGGGYSYGYGKVYQYGYGKK